MGAARGAAPPAHPPAPSAAAAAAVRAARTRLGTPYRFGGRTTAGFDCSGLVLWSYGAAGLPLPRTSHAMYRRGWAIGRGALRPGDLVFFDAAGPGASHVGIAVGRATAISATSSSGVAVHDVLTGYWGEHYVGARRLVRG